MNEIIPLEDKTILTDGYNEIAFRLKDMFNMKRTQQTRTIFLLAGSFMFAFLLGEMVHEGGHYFAHLCFGHQGISIHLDPFGGSRILGVSPMPLRETGITTAAGPGLNLAAGMIFSALFLRFSSPALLPFTVWGPVALIQEGVNASLGLLSHGSDAQWLAQWGMPKLGLVSLGLIFILAGSMLISWILNRSMLLAKSNPVERFLVIFLSIGFLMILRALVSTLQSPEAALENGIPLIFALILTAIIATTQSVWRSQQSTEVNSPRIPSRVESLLPAALGLAALIIQVILP